MSDKPNKEQAYDNEVAPLMDKVIAICRREGISMICHFELPVPSEPDLRCTTKLPDGNGHTSHIIQRMLAATRFKPADVIGRGGIPRESSPL